MFATISADIVSSTSLSVDETIRLKQRIEALFALLKTRYPDFSFSIMFHKRIVLFGSAFGKGLEPMGIVGNS